MTGRSSRLDAVGCDVGASSPWERRVGPNMSRGGTQKRVSLGLHPVSLRKSKEMGWNGQDQRGLLPNKTAHTYRAQIRCRLVFALYVCADTSGGGRWLVLPFDPISLVLAQRNGVEPPKKSAFYLGGSTIRVSAAASVVFTHLRPTWGGGWWLSERLPSPGANGIGYGRFARSVDLAGVTVVYRFRLPPKARFFGAPPRFFAQEQRNGVERAAGGGSFCPRGRRTRTVARVQGAKKPAVRTAGFPAAAVGTQL